MFIRLPYTAQCFYVYTTGSRFSKTNRKREPKLLILSREGEKSTKTSSIGKKIEKASAKSLEKATV